ncbi:MAG: SUMF1/EgtB/PvdO family nonheme iron enzyme [Planctomycetes bacterium]|nr:SUMF1/EgtB/PvdO family nonheme iron enzyme [Planctomycetota bacterium]
MDHTYRTHPVDGGKMVLIPAGAFIMGCPADDIFAKPHEQPQRMVWLSAYWMDVFPVTNARYKRFIEDGGYENRDWWTPAGWEWRRESGVTAALAWNKPGWDAAEQPVSGVSWYEADAYGRWAGKALPTDAQWERAARGTDGRRFPWGETFPRRELANFNNQVGRVTPVGSYPEGVSPSGCHDMAGNVNNWCLDWYWPEFYAYAAKHGLDLDPVLNDGLKAKLGLEAALKCDRGGGFATDEKFLEILSCTDKVAWEPQTRELWNGFRTVQHAD